MKKPENIVGKILHLFLVYIIGVFLGCLFHILRLIENVRILHKERIPHNHEDQGLLVISNHLSLLEPILLPLLFFRDYILHPFKLCPISIPDKANYLDKWYWWWLRFCSIPINRNDKREGMKALFKMRDVLNGGGIIIPFLEGGRTCFGKDFLYSKNGKRIRILEGARGISWLISQTNPLILFVWIEGADDVLPNSLDRNKLYRTLPRLWKQMTIKIGKPVCFRKGLEPEVIVQEVAAMLLNLADEEE